MNQALEHECWKEKNQREELFIMRNSYLLICTNNGSSSKCFQTPYNAKALCFIGDIFISVDI